MEYLIELRFEDKGYNAIIHFLATFNAKDDAESQLFVEELIAGFTRKGVDVFPPTYYRIDNNPQLKERSREYYEFYRARATATIEIEQFLLDNPKQNKSLFENLTERLFAGEDSTAKIGNKYKIPVRVVDKNTRNPIAGDIYYFTVEHLIPKE